jgi:GTPase
MINDEFVKNFFGSDDDDSEKFFNKKDKKQRKISYHPNTSQTNSKKKKKKERKNLSVENKEKTFFSDNSLIPVERKISIDMSQFKLEKKKYDIEYDYGNVEYKLKLCDVNVQRIQELTTQMKFRLGEGCGECYYEIGVEDNGNTLGISKEELEISLSVINTIAINLGCKAKIAKLIQGKEGLIAEMYIKKQEENFINKIEVTIGVLGEQGTGKTTLIGVLTNGMLDNGKGMARRNVFRHKHELLSGKTSSFSHQILGFDEKGELTNYGDLLRPSLSQIVNKSTKIINFYDMAGSPKNFNRTTISALSTEYLDYLLFVISANEPITKITENLLRFIFNVDLPIITIINKIDLIKDEELTKVVKKYKETIKKLNNELNKEKIPIVMKDNDDVVLFSSNMEEKEIMLIFLVSNLKWDGGLTLFKNFLGVLPEVNKTSDKQKQKELELEKMEFDIHEIIYKETNAILIGIVSSGKLRIKSKCFLGPDINGNFKMVEVCDIHCKKISVSYSYKGQYCSVCIKSLGDINTLTRDNVKKGMSLLDIRNTPIASRLFEIELWTIDDTTKSFKNTYQPILHIKHVRQGVKIKNPDELFLFLSDNKKVNDLESLINDDNLTLDNVNDKINSLIEKKKSKNKNNFVKIKNDNNINNNINNNKKNDVVKNIKIIHNNNNKNDDIKNIKIIQNNKNHQKEKDKEKDCENNHSLFNFNDEITIGPADKKTKLVVEFLFNPEYISVGQKIIINDQSLKACGIITKIFK